MAFVVPLLAGVRGLWVLFVAAIIYLPIAALLGVAVAKSFGLKLEVTDEPVD